MLRFTALAAGLLLTFCFVTVQGQALYVKTYGNCKNPTIVYVHGGPRGNATLFEATTAQSLSDAGFYVVVYDRRGEGRSPDPAATFTFAEAVNDLRDITDQLAIEKVSIIGHSFGAIVSTMYARAFPKRTERLILVGGLVAQQRTYDHILTSVARRARTKGDTATLIKIRAIKLLNKNSAEYRGKTYDVASAYGYFRMPYPTEESDAVNKRYTETDFFRNNIRNDQAPILFYQNEKQVNIDTTPLLAALKNHGSKLYGLYGKQDGIFSDNQINSIRKLTGKDRFFLVDNCSHYPFADQQKIFVDTISKIMKD